MTIDPMAAVSTATGGAGSPAATIDSAASANNVAGSQHTTQTAASRRAADHSNKVDLFDYTTKHQSAPPAIDTLTPEGKAKYLANPAELGAKVLEKMESFHQRSQDFYNDFQNGPSPQATASSGDSVMGGPAEQHVAGTAKTTDEFSGMFEGLRRVMDHAVETTMVTTTSSQFGKSLNMLMRGQ